MSLKSTIALLGILISQITLADVPVEVIGSCKNVGAVNSSVTYTKMLSPLGMDDSSSCNHHIEITEEAFNYGAIICNNENYLILQGTRINLSTAINHSVNPSYQPGAAISQQADWAKITFNNIDYLCIDYEISPSGKGGGISQYYIVENAFNTSAPIINYYLFDRDIIPTASVD